MALFVKHTPCPKCGSRDNRAVYSDGSSWCFGCHHSEPPSGESFNPYTVAKMSSLPSLPELSTHFPQHVVQWLSKYDISVEEALKHGWKYNSKYDQLVFLYCGEDGRVVCSQARNFAPQAKRKYFNEGSVASVLPLFYVLGSEKRSRSVVVVEDAVSAAKISRVSDAIPCLGSHLPKNKISALRLLNYEEMVVWLDGDKYREALQIAEQARLVGFSTKIVHTELDPKEHSVEEIKEKLNG